MTAFNAPSSSLINLIKKLEYWKFVVISNTDNIKINNIWRLLQFSNNLIYLTLKEQINLGYEITKFIKLNSYSRKNIGYLYAIQHGAKEIYEIDEDIIINEISNISFNKNIFYGIRNDSKMINPYNHFGEKNIWPRGFSIKDIGKDYNNKFFIVKPRQLNIKPLIYQGLINGIPDVDSIYFQTNSLTNISFRNIGPLIYFPGNYIPINSKNTKYLYEIFPFLALPNTINEKISDIFRGFIIQYFSWRLNGCVIYSLSKAYQYKYSFNSQFINEKKLFYYLDDFIKIINLEEKNYNNFFELFYKIIKNLIKNNLLGKYDFKFYRAYFKDLSNIGYIYSNKFLKNINYNYRVYINIYSEFNYYLPKNPSIIIKKNNKNINILLIINYNNRGFEILNNYIKELYLKYFNNIVFITPSLINSKNIISCNGTHHGYYSYICFKKVYDKYPNFKGYLYTNDDDFMKIWELKNLDFNIPWLYKFRPLCKRCIHYPRCKNLYYILNNNSNWKINLTYFLGNKYYIPLGLSDFYYIPNYIASQICEIFKVMYNSKVFLECAVPTSFGILLKKEYQLIYLNALWRENRKKAINYLIKDYFQITIHPIKLFNFYFNKKVNQYIYFINAKEY